TKATPSRAGDPASEKALASESVKPKRRGSKGRSLPTLHKNINHLEKKASTGWKETIANESNRIQRTKESV
ncbi:unnamed protein product, partial [Gulo gulo]